MKYSYLFDSITHKDEDTITFGTYKEALTYINKHRLSGTLYKWDIDRDEIVEGYEKYFTKGTINS